jgi:hypothetical protein
MDEIGPYDDIPRGVEGAALCEIGYDSGIFPQKTPLLRELLRRATLAVLCAVPDHKFQSLRIAEQISSHEKKSHAEKRPFWLSVLAIGEM